jgi:hypothetical protein
MAVSVSSLDQKSLLFVLLLLEPSLNVFQPFLSNQIDLLF